MSMQPQLLPEIPEDTARLARVLYKRKGNIYVTIGDQIGPLFADVDFADLYAADGKPLRMSGPIRGGWMHGRSVSKP